MMDIGTVFNTASEFFQKNNACQLVDELHVPKVRLASGTVLRVRVMHLLRALASIRLQFSTAAYALVCMGPCARGGVIFQNWAFFLGGSMKYAAVAYDFAKDCKIHVGKITIFCLGDLQALTSYLHSIAHIWAFRIPNFLYILSLATFCTASTASSHCKMLIFRPIGFMTKRGCS